MKKIFIYFCFFLVWSNWSYAECTSGNCVNGQGTYTFTNGVKYVGEFKNGKPEGQGTMTYPDGSKFSGQFKNGRPVK